MTGKRRKLNVFIWLIIIEYYNTVCGTSLGDTCTTDEDCSSLVNTKCSKMYDCQTGVCACQAGYGNSNGDGCDKMLRSYDQTCGVGYYCNGFEEECSGGRCKCTYWYNYSNQAQQCTLRTYKLLTQSCGYWNGAYHDCLDGDGIECNTNGKCGCQDGYIADPTDPYVTCRAPQWNERCLWNPSCTVEFDTSTISDDFSSTTPSCSNNICTCPPSHEHKVVDRYNLCLNKVDSDFVRSGLGENCTHFVDCESLLCVKCPGSVTGVCMQGRSSGSISQLTIGWSSSVLYFVTIVSHFYD